MGRVPNALGVSARVSAEGLEGSRGIEFSPKLIQVSDEPYGASPIGFSYKISKWLASIQCT